MIRTSTFFACGLMAVTFSTLRSQNQDRYFKVPLAPTAEQAEWVRAMYSADPLVGEVVSLYDAYYRDHGFVKNIHTQNFKFWIKNVESLIGEDGRIVDPDSRAHKEKVAGLYQQKGQALSRSKSSTWQSVGPYDTYRNNGSLETRVTQVNIFCLAVAPSDHDILYSVSEEGGIFKSIDHGENWTAVSEGDPFVKGQDIKIHPTDPDIVYFGTGSDIYKTTDGGVNWNLIHTAPGTIEQFYIHRADPTDVYAATANGLIFSSNSGLSWSTLRNDRCWDIEAHPVDPDIIYLSVHNAVARRAEVFKSIDAGTEWTLKDTGWYVPTEFANATDSGCKIAVTPADPDRVYTCLIGNSKAGDNGWIGVYYSLNGGDTWVNPDGIDGGPYVAGSDLNTNWFYAGYSSGYHQGWYNFDLDVSHTDPDKIWIGTIWDMESGNRGENIEYIRGTRNLAMHADVQDIDVVGGDIWFASDGGINYSDDEMATVGIRHSGIYASDFWGFSQGWNEDTWTGGRYHNGNATYHENYAVGNTVFQGGAEAATGYINPLDNRHCYYSDINDILTPDQVDEAAIGTFNISRYPNESHVALNSSELEFDPRYADHLYLGDENVFYKSTDGGGTFSGLFTFPAGSRVLELEISRADPLRIYCVVLNGSMGTIYRSNDGGNSFSPTANVPTNNTNRLGLTLSASDPDDLWVSSRYGVDGQKVYQSMNGGQSWINRTTSALDGHSMEEIVYQYGTDDLVYLSTGVGFFYWESSSASWLGYAQGLPFITKVLKTIPFYRDGKIRQSSGRGIWEVDLAAPSMPLAQPLTKTDSTLCLRDTIYFEDFSVLLHEGATWQWEFSPTPAYVSSLTSRNPKVVAGTDGSIDVTLTVTDQAGNSSTKTIQDMVTIYSQCEPVASRGDAMRLTNSGDIAQTTDLGLENVTEFTMSAWLKPAAIQNIYTGIVISDNTASGFNFRENNEIGFHWDNSKWWWNSGLFAPVGEWSHVAVVFCPTETTVYVNGIASVNTADNPAVDMTSFKFGSYHGWSGRNYNGLMDEVCMWTRALTEEEIRESRHLTRTGIDAFSEDLLAYYQFNGIGSTSVLDKVGLGHAQMLAGAVLEPSTAPIAGGVSDLLSVGSAGEYVFDDTQSEVTFASAMTGRDVVVTRWDPAIDDGPEVEALVDNGWVVNNYGADFPSPPTFSLSTGGTVYYGSPSDARLFSRSENGDASWSEQCSAMGKTLTSFTFDASCSLTGSAQFSISDPQGCPADLNGDGAVDVNDFILLNSFYGSSCASCTADTNGDGEVDIADFLFFNTHFGSDCD